MADIDLPVFSFHVNWKEPIVERLSFLTDILQSRSSGAEQRRSLRETPRRSFECDLLLTGRERTFWDLFMDGLGAQEVVAPLYWEVTTLQSALTATVSDRIDFDTSYREWESHTGYLAILMGDTALDYEVVEIASVDSGGVDLTAAVTRPWPRGTKLLPLRRMVIDQVSEVRHPTAAVATVSVELRVIGPNAREVPASDWPVYAGLPVFLDEPNWVEGLAVDLDRRIDVLDTGAGLTYQRDSLGRVLLGQAHRWFLPGREKLSGFRDLVYRMRGRSGVFWLPTFKADFKLVNSPGSGATQIEVENAGYAYTGGPRQGRGYIAIKHTGGTILRKVVSVIPGTTSATEKLNLDAPLGLALSPGQVRRISFAETARFDTDDFEITHFGGVDSHHESTTTFRSLNNVRTAPEPISYPIPEATMNSTPCGVPPWYIRVRVEWLNPSTPEPLYGFYVDPAIGPTIDYNDDNPNANHSEVVPYEYIEMIWVTDDLPSPQMIDLRLQFQTDTVSNAMRARVKIKRYGEADYTVYYPLPGSETLADGAGWFDVRGLWPDNWFFDI